VKALGFFVGAVAKLLQSCCNVNEEFAILFINQKFIDQKIISLAS